MKSSQETVPIHLLNEHTHIGIKVMRYINVTSEKSQILGAHRDDHYIFLILEKGFGRVVVDFQNIELDEGSLYFVRPGQIHEVYGSLSLSGWFVAVDSALLTAEQRQVFEHRVLLQQPILLSCEQMDTCTQLLIPLFRQQESDHTQPFFLQVLYALLQAFTGTIAAMYLSIDQCAEQPKRKTEITYAFKNLLREGFRHTKSPSAFAGKLNISSVYLNEAVKRTTGLPVSYWIIQEIILEAKRLLCYSKLNVKEIAQELGYEDHTYFSRLFKEQTGITPLAFRRDYLA